MLMISPRESDTSVKQRIKEINGIANETKSSSPRLPRDGSSPRLPREIANTSSPRLSRDAASLKLSRELAIETKGASPRLSRGLAHNSSPNLLRVKDLEKEIEKEEPRSATPENRPSIGKVANRINLLAAAGKQKSTTKLPIPKLHKPPFIESLSPNLQDVIKEWLPNKEFFLIYQASRDGFEEEQFHLLCDNKGPTLSLIQSSEGFLLGGYSPEDWESPEKPVYKTNPSTFIFTLTNPHSLPPTKYTFLGSDDKAYSTKCSKRYGITFGEQVYWAADIQVSSSDHCGYANINFPVSFVDTTGKGDSTFTGSSRSLTHDVLVYCVK